MASSRREEEYAKIYKDTGDKSYKDKAVNEMRDLIYDRVRAMNLSKGLDTRTLYMKGMGIALEAVETWDPSRAKLSTHVINSLKVLHRDINKYSPTLHVPEHNIKKFATFKRTYAEYVNEYGLLDPDPVELVDRSGLTKKEIEEFLIRERKTYNSSTDSFRPIEYLKSDYRVDVDYLSDQFKEDPLTSKVWKEIAKSLKDKNAPPPNAKEISRKLNKSYYEVNKVFTEIVKVLNEYITTSGN